MSEVQLVEIIGAFDNAKNARDYRRAIRRAKQLCTPLEQLALVDSIRDARRRLGVVSDGG